jgi:hypothetical protein
MINRKPTTEKLEKLWKLCANFVEDEDVVCEESIYQREDIMMACPDFLEQIANIIGYKEIKE